MSDVYEFSKSQMTQSVSEETPYVSKNFSFLPDINGGQYSGTGVSLVQFDLSSIFNSSALIDPSQIFLAIPIILTSAYVSSVTTGATVTPGANASCIHALKNGYHNLIHSIELTVNSKSIEQTTPFLNAYTGFKLMSQMSQDDLATLGPTIGMGNSVDNVQSMRFNPPSLINAVGAAFNINTAVNTNITGSQNGNGITNNAPFSVNIAAGTLASNAGDQGAMGSQFSGCYNQGLYSRMKKYTDITNNTVQNFYGVTAGINGAATTIMSETNIISEFKAYTKVLTVGTQIYTVTQDVAIIRLCDILDSMKNLCLMKRFDGILRVYLNTGSVASAINSYGQMITSSSLSTFVNTCPLIQTSLTTIPANVVAIVSSLSIGKVQSTNLFGLNLALCGVTHPMVSCRIYYPQIILKPEKLRNYISENRAKKIVYTSILYNSFNNITSGATSSFLVQSGVSNIRGLLIIPFLSSTINGLVTGVANAITGVTSFSQLASPFDTAPMTTGPYSLGNLQVTVGGVNILNNTLNYSYENFIEQVMLYEKINNADLGLSCGLISENYWQNSRFYYVDCSRSNIGDMMTPRNINISFSNNSNVTIDCMVFTEFFQEMVVDVETGFITK